MEGDEKFKKCNFCGGRGKYGRFGYIPNMYEQDNIHRIVKHSVDHCELNRKRMEEANEQRFRFVSTIRRLVE